MWNLSDNSALYCFILQLYKENRLHFQKDRLFGPVLTPNLQLCQIRLQTPIYPFMLVLADFHTSIQIRFRPRCFRCLCLNFRAQYHTSPWASHTLHLPYTTHSHIILILIRPTTPIMELTLLALSTNSMQFPLCFPKRPVCWHPRKRAHLHSIHRWERKKAVQK